MTLYFIAIKYNHQATQVLPIVLMFRTFFTGNYWNYWNFLLLLSYFTYVLGTIAPEFSRPSEFEQLLAAHHRPKLDSILINWEEIPKIARISDCKFVTEFKKLKIKGPESYFLNKCSPGVFLSNSLYKLTKPRGCLSFSWNLVMESFRFSNFQDWTNRNAVNMIFIFYPKS